MDLHLEVLNVILFVVAQLLMVFMSFGEKDEYHEALALGEVLVTYSRVMMIGPGGAGKSSLLRGLMNQTLPDLAASTPLANAMHVKYQMTRVGDSASQPWVQLMERDYISELAHLITRVLQAKSHPHHLAALLKLEEVSEAETVFQPSVVPDVSSEDPTQLPQARGIYDQVMYQVQRRIRSLSLHQGTQKTEVFLHVWDSGGQVVFLDILPALLTARTIFLLVFNSSKDLNKLLQVHTIQKGEIVHTEDYHLTTTEILLQWMASIHAHLSLRQHSKEIQPYPRILLVGTHLDELIHKSSNYVEAKENIKTHLSSHYKGKAYSRLLLPTPCYFVDNTTAGHGENEDPTFKELRQEIHKFASDNLAVRTPASWVLFRKVIQMFSQENKKAVIAYSEAVAIAKACSIPSKAVPSVLNFYHELGVFLYYSNITKLQQIVIVDPRWLIDELAKLFMPPGFKKRGDETSWELLHTQGILSEELYHEIWQNGEISPQGLVDLLEYFLLAVHIKRPTMHKLNTGAKEYFVPCMLNSPSRKSHLPSSGAEAKAFDDTAEPLHLVFNTNYVPPGFFVRLLASLAKQSQCCLLSTCINRYQVPFAYGEVDEVVLKEQPDSIQITMTRAVKGEGHVPPFKHMCRKFLQVAMNCIDEVKDLLPAVEVSTAFKCSCDRRPPRDPAPHFVCFTQTTHCKQHLRCKLDQLCKSTSLQQKWLQGPPEDVKETKANPCAASKAEALVMSASEPDLRDLMNEVAAEIPTKWRRVGLELGLERATLDMIEEDRRGKQMICFEDVLSTWMKRDQASWDTIVHTLRAPQVDESRLADRLEGKFLS